MADDQRFDLLNVLGRTPCQTLSLDRFVARRTCYTQAHTLGSTHGAMCAPSRAMLHTGWSPDPPVIDPEQVPLLGELLRRQLFDLEQDPWETRDLATDAGHIQTRARLNDPLNN